MSTLIHQHVLRIMRNEGAIAFGMALCYNRPTGTRRLPCRTWPALGRTAARSC